MHGKCTQVRLVGSRDQFQFFIKKYIAFLIYFSGEILEFLKFCRLRQFPGTDYATTKGKAYLASMATLCKQSEIETIANGGRRWISRFLAGMRHYLRPRLVFWQTRYRSFGLRKKINLFKSYKIGTKTKKAPLRIWNGASLTGRCRRSSSKRREPMTFFMILGAY